MDSVPQTSGIYMITCTANGKIYIGSTQNFRERWGRHRAELNSGRHENRHLLHAWRKFGEQCFIFEVIELVAPELRIEREQYWLDKLQPFGDTGFNLARCAQAAGTGLKHTPETKAKISAANKGRRVSEEVRLKISQAGKGRKKSPETCAKLSAVHKGKPKSEEHRAKLSVAKRGQTPTAETRAKLSAIHKGTTKSVEARAKISEANRHRSYSTETLEKMSVANSNTVWILTSPEGHEYKTISLRAFCREHKLHRAHLTEVANGKAIAHKGWKCKRA